MTLIFSFNTFEDISVCVCVCVRCQGCLAWRHAPPLPSSLLSDGATHPVDEDVAWQSGGGLLQAAEAVHHPAVVKGQCDLCQTASCTTEQETCFDISVRLSSLRKTL